MPRSSRIASTHNCMVRSSVLETPSCQRNSVVYLLTGESDSLYSAWSGGLLERAKRAHDDLRGALVRAVSRLTKGLAHAPMSENDTVALTRAKIEPMVRGLFPRAEQDEVLARLEQSVIFTTSANIEKILRECSFDGTAWTLANLHLASFGAELLSRDAPHLVGMSEETTCYVSPDYFTGDDPFADFIVHEAAHVFHNCKRATIGLPETRTKEWMLDIEYPSRHADFSFRIYPKPKSWTTPTRSNRVAHGPYR